MRYVPTNILNPCRFTAAATLYTLAALAVLTAPAAGQEPASDIDMAYVAMEDLVNRKHSNLFRLEYIDGSFDLNQVCQLDFAVNNIGFCHTNGLVYGWKRNPRPRQLFRIVVENTPDKCDVEFFTVSGIPPDEMFMAGDIAPDCSKMYFQSTHNDRLYAVPLDSGGLPGTATFIDIEGDIDSPVADWAVYPKAGIDLLFGADKEGDLAILDPNTGERADLEIPHLLPQLESEERYGYGAAWFDHDGKLFLYSNQTPSGFGEVYEIYPPIPFLRDGAAVGCVRNDAGAVFGGCRSNDHCMVGQNDYCEKAPGSCSEYDYGVCKPKPTTCPPDDVEVCGCDGLRYANECEAARVGVSVSVSDPDPGQC